MFCILASDCKSFVPATWGLVIISLTLSKMFLALKKIFLLLIFYFICLVLFYLLNSSICFNSLECLLALYDLFLFKYVEECGRIIPYCEEAKATVKLVYHLTGTV